MPKVKYLLNFFLRNFKFSLLAVSVISLYHIMWHIYGFLEHFFHWGNGTETLLFVYYMTIYCFKPEFPLPNIFSSEGYNMIFYSFVFFAILGFCCDGIYFLIKRCCIFFTQNRNK